MFSIRHDGKHFNSRPSARGDTRNSLHYAKHCYFNSRPSARGDNSASTSTSTGTISIHAPPRGATSQASYAASQEAAISIHAPPRGATQLASASASCDTISIHAPPRGATKSFRSLSSPPRRFQFTPLREGRPLVAGRSRRPAYFNSRPSARGDGKAALPGLAGEISIHAPPRGATLLVAHAVNRRKFQFTPLREGRRAGLVHRAGMHNFNSRPSARGDMRGNRRFRPARISIHAPPRGATMRRIRAVCLPFNFNSRPSARGDRTFSVLVSIPREIAQHDRSN